MGAPRKFLKLFVPNGNPKNLCAARVVFLMAKQTFPIPIIRNIEIYPSLLYMTMFFRAIMIKFVR